MGDEKNSDRAKAIAEEAEALNAIHESAEKEGEDAARKAVHVAALEQETRILNLSRGDDDTSVAGHRSRNPRSNKGLQAASARRTQEVMDAIMLQDQLAAWETELAEIKEGLGAIDKLRELEKSGKFDKENPDHIAYLIAAGIDPDDYFNGDTIGDYMDKLRTGQIGPNDPVPPEVQAIVDKYNEANPNIPADPRSIDDMRHVKIWAEQRRDNAAEQVRDIQVAGEMEVRRQLGQTVSAPTIEEDMSLDDLLGNSGLNAPEIDKDFAKAAEKPDLDNVSFEMALSGNAKVVSPT